MKKFYWLFLADCYILVWIGACEVATPFVEIGQLATLFFFVYLLVIIPALGKFETLLLTRKV